MRLLLLTLSLLLAFPAQAEVTRPGNDLGADPSWSKEFLAGMLAIRQQDMDGAMAHFVKCVNEAKTPDANCEYYLSMMYYQKGDLADYRKYINLAAQHGSEAAITLLNIESRFQ